MGYHFEGICVINVSFSNVFMKNIQDVVYIILVLYMYGGLRPIADNSSVILIGYRYNVNMVNQYSCIYTCSTGSEQAIG